MIEKNMTLAEVVKEFPHAIDIFNEYNLDYCCGGNDSLSAALEEKEIDIPSFVDKLNKAKEAFSSNQATKLNTSLYDLTPADLIDFIEDSHHIEERDLLYKLDGLVNKILIVHYEDYKEELIPVHHLFSDLKKELEEHFIKEEKLVFPLLKEANAENMGRCIELMEELKAEHEAAGEIIKKLQEVTRNFQPPRGVCPTYISTYQNLKALTDDIFLHIYTENSILFEKIA